MFAKTRGSSSLADLLAASSADLDVRVLRSRAELERARNETADRVALEQLICDSLVEHKSWSLPGICQACGKPTHLEGDWQFSDGRTANLRERLVCPRCHLNNRQRFMAHLMRTALGHRPDRVNAYLYEQVTPFFTWAERALDGDVAGSEYLGPHAVGGEVVDGVRHEDAQALGFNTASLDVVVSCDVFEHVPDIDRALSESARVLRAGGTMFFSIPFHEQADASVCRADLRNGTLVELLPPEYHGNPISEGGSLVFHDLGWDILDRTLRAGFRDAYLLGYYSWLYGYLGGGLQLLFVAER